MRLVFVDGCWEKKASGLLVSCCQIVLSAEARVVSERNSKPSNRLLSSFGVLFNAVIVLNVAVCDKDECND